MRKGRAEPAPHTGSRPIPEAAQNAVRMNHAQEHYAGKYRQIDVRFKGAPYYVDAYQEPAPGSEAVAGTSLSTTRIPGVAQPKSRSRADARVT
jgi:hypothetical protein